MKNHDLTIRHKMLSFGSTLCAAQRLARPRSSFPFYEKLYTYVSPRVSGKQFLKWGPKGGILIFVDNGPLGCYLWCHGDCLLGFLTFIQFAHGHGHAVIDDWILYTYIVVSSSTFSILKLDNIKDGNIWKVKIGI